MRHRKKGLVVLLTICMVAATLSVPYSITSSAEDYYRSNVVYDASEDNLNVQSVPDSYNGYKIHPFAKSDTWLADNLKIGDKNSLVSYGEVAKGDKMVIEFKNQLTVRSLILFLLQSSMYRGIRFKRITYPQLLFNFTL